LVARTDDHRDRGRRRPRPWPVGGPFCRAGLRPRAPHRLIAWARDGPPHQCLRGDGGLRLGERARPELATSSGLLRSAGLLRWILGALRPDPQPAVDRRDVPEPGLRWVALALHPGLRNVDEPRPAVVGQAPE